LVVNSINRLGAVCPFGHSEPLPCPIRFNPCAHSFHCCRTRLTNLHGTALPTCLIDLQDRRPGTPRDMLRKESICRVLCLLTHAAAAVTRSRKRAASLTHVCALPETLALAHSLSDSPQSIHSQSHSSSDPENLPFELSTQQSATRRAATTFRAPHNPSLDPLALNTAPEAPT